MLPVSSKRYGIFFSNFCGLLKIYELSYFQNWAQKNSCLEFLSTCFFRLSGETCYNFKKLSKSNNFSRNIRLTWCAIFSSRNQELIKYFSIWFSVYPFSLFMTFNHCLSYFPFHGLWQFWFSVYDFSIIFPDYFFFFFDFFWFFNIF